MEDYEKFDQMINNSESMQNSDDPELAQMVQITQMLKHQQPEPRYTAKANSKRLMLAEAEQIRESSSQRRMSLIGSLYGWAVPAILLFAVIGVVFGNSSRDVLDEPDLVDPISAPSVLVTVASEEIDEEIETLLEVVPTVTITPTATFSMTNDSVTPPPTPDDLVPYPDPDSDSIDPAPAPDSDNGEADQPVPERPEPGSEIKPPEDEKKNDVGVPIPSEGTGGVGNPDS